MASHESLMEARRVDRMKQTKFCPACGSKMLGGVRGDHSLVGCTDCGHATSKYLMKYDPLKEGASMHPQAQALFDTVVAASGDKPIVAYALLSDRDTATVNPVCSACIDDLDPIPVGWQLAPIDADGVQAFYIDHGPAFCANCGAQIPANE